MRDKDVKSRPNPFTQSFLPSRVPAPALSPGASAQTERRLVLQKPAEQRGRDRYLKN